MLSKTIIIASELFTLFCWKLEHFSIFAACEIGSKSPKGQDWVPLRAPDEANKRRHATHESQREWAATRS